MTGRYQEADAFRDALEQRIRNVNQETGRPHDRLRKDVAFHRLVARFIAAGDVRWALKGGVALLWRLAADARATRDVDANWRGTQDDLVAFLDRVVASPGGDWFEFEIGLPQSIEGETEGGARFGVTARLAGREFTAFRLDVNFVTDARPIELIRIEVPLLAFVGLADLEVPMISVSQQLAEKLHAVARTYTSGDSSRAKDAFDSVLFAQAGVLSDAGTMRESVASTFAVRDTPVPSRAPSLPTAWTEALKSLIDDFAPSGVEDVKQLETFWLKLWQPILDGTAPLSAWWNPNTASWTDRSR
jgi:hypothetical protein